MDRTPEPFATALESGDTDRVNDAIDEIEAVDALEDLVGRLPDEKAKHAENAKRSVERVGFADGLVSNVENDPL